MIVNVFEFGKVVVFGIGLIGGFFVFVLKEVGVVEEVVGFGCILVMFRVVQ